MADVWFVIVCVLLVGYVVLDGFDFGAGVLHRIVARTDAQRREVIAAIGPFWDGNEVFLLAAGGALFLAFSRVLAVGLSGLYLAVMLVLWGILLRGISLELRSHLRDSMWRSFWDVVFQLASGLLALLLGVALGCVLRGFPLGEDGYFGLELFSFESPTRGLGVIDAYTLFTGLFALLLITQHGGRFLAMRTRGEVAARSKSVAQRLTVPVAIAWVVVTGLTYVFARPAAATFADRPWAWPLVPIAAGALYLGWYFGRSEAAGRAFLASCAAIVALLGIAATSMYPVLLRSTTDAPALDVTNAASPDTTLGLGLRWWFFAFALVVGYFVNLARIHRGPATPYGEGGDHDAEEPSAAHHE
ncbi:MAG: cytochrome d ubiquinol oxidase subunit II [Deltaproteobacteria bacterium]|nr:cytochrome d ubiquinol oxidase subunit II [Deltaproteobacteria bacterium]